MLYKYCIYMYIYPTNTLISQRVFKAYRREVVHEELGFLWEKFRIQSFNILFVFIFPIIFLLLFIVAPAVIRRHL